MDKNDLAITFFYLLLVVIFSLFLVLLIRYNTWFINQ